MKKLLLILLFLGLTFNCFADSQLKTKEEKIKMYEKMFEEAKSERKKALTKESIEFWQREVEQIEGEIIREGIDEIFEAKIEKN